MDWCVDPTAAKTFATHFWTFTMGFLLCQILYEAS